MTEPSPPPAAPPAPEPSVPLPTDPRLRHKQNGASADGRGPGTTGPNTSGSAGEARKAGTGAGVAGSGAESGPYWQLPSLDKDNRIVGGVAAGIGNELGLDAIWVRIAFVILFAIGGWGAVLYALAWGGVAFADYRGIGSTAPPTPKGKSAQGRLTGFVLAVSGLVVVFAGFNGIDGDLAWSSVVIGIGLLIVWRQVSSRSTTRSVGRIGYAMLLFGFAVTAGGAVLLSLSIQGTGSALLPIILIVVALIVVVGASPWWWRMLSDLDAERQARVRSEERAVVAAHLHDSVLQTLALIQKSSGDSQRMAALARRQERELRNWLDPNRASREGLSVRGQLDDMASDVEELYNTPVEIVAVGDCLVDEPIEGVLAAAREAVVNAAKHSGADQIDLFVEVSDDMIEIFVRDTGVGFDPASIAADRRGVSESIEARMERIGGSVTIYSALGEGTEVELQLTRDHPDTDPSDAHPSEPNAKAT